MKLQEDPLTQIETAARPAESAALATARCWAEVSAAALVHNARLARKRLGPGETRLMAVVKADAYGHGARHTARALEAAGAVEQYAVANLAEAREIAKLAEPGRIIILGPALPAERAGIVEGGFVPMLSSAAEARAYAELARQAGVTLRAHLKIDTGMGRIGVLQQDAAEACEEVLGLDQLKVEAIATHLPVADEDAVFTADQMAGYHELLQKLSRAGVALDGLETHAQNSSGILDYGGRAFSVARPGLMLYGVSPTGQGQELLRPALQWKSRVALARELPAGHGISYGRAFVTTRPTRIATIACGYADGYPRSLSGQGAEVLIGGQRCPLLGRVTMDLIMADVTHLQAPAREGDEVVLLGRQGSETVTATELARLAGTIPWEIFTNISARVPRFPVD